jgi:hypothetical protein
MGPSVGEDALVTQSFHNGTHVGARGPNQLGKFLLRHSDVNDIADTVVAGLSLEAHEISENHSNSPQ